jgi:hypothetical protein
VLVNDRALAFGCFVSFLAIAAALQAGLTSKTEPES